MDNKTEKKWYQKPTAVVLLLIFFFPVGLYLMWKNELWTKQTRWIVTAVIAVVIVANAGSNGSSRESALQIGEKYNFFDGSNGKLECPECDPCWHIKFKDEKNAELWSEPCSGSTYLKSCRSDVSYKFDKTTNTVTILSIVNSNVSSECKNRFIGEWQWSEGEFGKRFYSKNNPGADFH